MFICNGAFHYTYIFSISKIKCQVCMFQNSQHCNLYFKSLRGFEPGFIFEAEMPTTALRTPLYKRFFLLQTIPPARRWKFGLSASACPRPPCPTSGSVSFCPSWWSSSLCPSSSFSSSAVEVHTYIPLRSQFKYKPKKYCLLQFPVSKIWKLVRIY
jgi:hypothetical protein